MIASFRVVNEARLCCCGDSDPETNRKMVQDRLRHNYSG